MSLQVLIAGGGIGGLALAQALHRSGIGVAVYERDAAVLARGQGYRFRVDADGDGALRECLPPNLYALYRATSNRPSAPPIGAFDNQFNLIYRLGEQPGSSNGHQAVNRLTLRQVLLGGLEEIVHFDKALVGFEQNSQGVRAQFADGSTATGDVLVAADGIHSAIRQQLLPHAEIIDTGMRCVYGKTPLTEEILSWLPEPLYGGFVPVLGPNGCTLALGMYRSLRPFAETVAEFAPTVHLAPVPDYLMWIFVAPKSIFTSAATPEELHRLVRERTVDWHPDLRRLLKLADVPATFTVPIRSARPVAPWASSRVTLLGDAIHVMTPAGGIGANTALKDAALLARQLAEVENGNSDLIAAIASYESAMRDYAFAAVERSLRGAMPLYRIPSLPEARE